MSNLEKLNVSQKHVMEMVQAGDSDHKKAIDKMTQLSKEDQQKWYADFMNNFGALEDA